jgi:Protein of unknown function (DUF3667)
MDDLGKSFPAAEGLVDAEQGSGKKQANEYCLNCGTKLQDVFCYHCGQKDIPKRQTLGELWTNFISSFWSYEGKFFQTTKYIVTRPGFLAVEYSQGKRESYYHPARMYVFISFVFFLLAFSLPDPDGEDTTPGLSKADSLEIAKIKTDPEEFIQGGGLDSLMKDVELDSSDRAEIDSAKSHLKKKPKWKKRKNGFSFSGDPYKSKESYDSAQLTKPEAERDGWFERKINLKVIEINKQYNNDSGKFGEDFKQAFLDNFSKVLFWLLPFFALVLKLLYVRRDYYFSEHLVFSIYYYNFFYLAGSLKMLVEQVPWLSWLGTVMSFWIFFYLLFAMKRMYGQGWGKTILKFFLFFTTFSILLGIGISIMAISLLLSF